jgi:hypothetical protein
MSRWLGTIVFVGLLTAGPAVQAQQSYTLKFKEPGEGERYEQKSSESKSTNVQGVDAKGKEVFVQNVNQGMQTIFNATVLKRASDQEPPNLEKRMYEKAFQYKDKDLRAMSYEGKTVLVEKRGGGFHINQEGGGPLTDDDAVRLAEGFNKSGSKRSNPADLLPKYPLKVDESWDLDVQVLAKAFNTDELVIAWPQGKYVGKLLRMYRKDNRQYGVLEFSLEMPIKSAKGFGKELTLVSGKLVAKIVFDGCLDGTSCAHSAKMQLNGEFALTGQVNGTQINVTASFSETDEDERVELSKK